MEYRKYRAKSFQEAKLKMLLDVGNKAYIISQKKVKEGGVLGFFGTPMVEITAGIMEHSAIAKASNPKQEGLSHLDPDFNRPRKTPEHQTLSDARVQNRHIYQNESQQHYPNANQDYQKETQQNYPNQAQQSYPNHRQDYGNGNGYNNEPRQNYPTNRQDYDNGYNNEPRQSYPNNRQDFDNKPRQSNQNIYSPDPQQGQDTHQPTTSQNYHNELSSPNQMDQLIYAKEKMEAEMRSGSNGNLRGELDEIKTLISRILDEKQHHTVTQAHDFSQTFNNPLQSREEEKVKDLIKMFLKNEDFDDNFINMICALPTTDLAMSGEMTPSKIKEYLKKKVYDTLQTSGGIQLDENTQNTIVLVGPTGVGKTTTLAKLGAYYGVFQRKKIKFISVDTYRVGAVQQLKLYADIMEIPFAKVNNVEEYKAELYNDRYDLVLVDTTGRNQKNLDEIRDIKKYIDPLQGKVYISLVISATTKYKDMVEILEKFDILNYSNIIITKLDETNTLGQIISAINPKRRALSYLTFGQSVPEDIEEASKEKLIDMVLKG